jgi:hypothetical protein
MKKQLAVTSLLKPNKPRISSSNGVRKRIAKDWSRANNIAREDKFGIHSMEKLPQASKA